MPDPLEPGTLTAILDSYNRGEPGAKDRLFQVAGLELKKIARIQRQWRKRGETLRTTVLVNQAYLRLAGKDHWDNRAHFFTAVAQAIENTLVDEFRRKKALKRGGDLIRVSLAEDMGQAERDPEFDALSQALDKLVKKHPRPAKAIRLSYFMGMTIQEIADLLGLSRRQINTELRFARAWLKQSMTGAGSQGSA